MGEAPILHRELLKHFVSFSYSFLSTIPSFSPSDCVRCPSMPQVVLETKVQIHADACSHGHEQEQEQEHEKGSSPGGESRLQTKILE